MSDAERYIPHINDLIFRPNEPPYIVVDVRLNDGSIGRENINREHQYAALRLSHAEFLSAVRKGLGLPEDHEVIAFEKASLPLPPGVVITIEGPTLPLYPRNGAIYYMGSLSEVLAGLDEKRKMAEEHWAKEAVKWSSDYRERIKK